MDRSKSAYTVLFVIQTPFSHASARLSFHVYTFARQSHVFDLIHCDTFGTVYARVHAVSYLNSHKHVTHAASCLAEYLSWIELHDMYMLYESTKG